MNNKLFFSLTLLVCTWQLHAHQLSNPILKAIDNAGLLNQPIVDILRVRQKIKELVTGKYIWHGAQSNLTVTDRNKTLKDSLHVIIKRPEALFGATFIVISPNHPHLFNFVASDCVAPVTEFVKDAKSRSLLTRYEQPNFKMVAAGTWALHPITQEKLPIFIGDYILGGYDTRITHAHVAIPAHDHNDFAVAQQNNLPIKLVITLPDDNKSTSSPQINKTTKQLMAAYPGEYSTCIIANSDFLNGSVSAANQNALEFLQKNNVGSEYAKPILYTFMDKTCSINDLQAIELALTPENKTLSAAQKEAFEILMLQAQSDFLHIVEQFLVNAKNEKEFMIELIEESCNLRKNKDAYLLHWAHMNTNESEKVIFKRDMNTFYTLTKFCGELIDFLGDFASSCTHALENLKNIKNNK